jgi:hypothetical protein
LTAQRFCDKSNDISLSQPSANHLAPWQNSETHIVESSEMTCGGDSTKPIACSLGPAELPRRFAFIRELNRRALREWKRDGTQLRLAYDGDAEPEVRELVAMERQCCAFLDFLMERQDRLFLVTVTAPIDATDAIAEIYSEFTAGTMS